MNGCHEAFYNAELVVEHFGDRCKAVGGARSVRNELCAFNVGFFVYTANEHWGVVFRRSRHNHIFGTGFDVCLCFFFCEEKAG